MSKTSERGDLLLDVKDLKIQGFSDEKWHGIIKGIEQKLHRGEIMRLIGESGAGQSRKGLAAL